MKKIVPIIVFVIYTVLLVGGVYYLSQKGIRVMREEEQTEVKNENSDFAVWEENVDNSDYHPFEAKFAGKSMLVRGKGRIYSYECLDKNGLEVHIDSQRETFEFTFEGEKRNSIVVKGNGKILDTETDDEQNITEDLEG